MAELSRRNEENGLLDSVIRIFMARVS